MLEYLKKIIIAYLAIIILITSFVSMDSHHIDTCDDEDCAICFIIRIAQNNSELIINTSIIFVLIRFLELFIAKVRKHIDIFYTSLVRQKVQLNE